MKRSKLLWLKRKMSIIWKDKAYKREINEMIKLIKLYEKEKKPFETLSSFKRRCRNKNLKEAL